MFRDQGLLHDHGSWTGTRLVLKAGVDPPFDLGARRSGGSGGSGRSTAPPGQNPWSPATHLSQPTHPLPGSLDPVGDLFPVGDLTANTIVNPPTGKKSPRSLATGRTCRPAGAISNQTARITAPTGSSPKRVHQGPRPDAYGRSARPAGAGPSEGWASGVEGGTAEPIRRSGCRYLRSRCWIRRPAMSRPAVPSTVR